jgi:uncharacterized iron-regulated membrane protein
MPLRKIAFWIHLACGVTAGAVILVMSVTGVLLTYQKQMTQWADRAHWVAPEIEGARAPLSYIVDRARSYDPEADVSSVVLYSDPQAPAAVSLGGGRTVYLDPSTGAVRGESATGMRTFMSATVRMHRWLGASGDTRATTRAITGWSNLVFLFLILSGLYLWVPRKWSWTHLRPALVLNPAARGKARDFNWHHVFGFWMAIPLAVVVGSATVISFPWASDLAYRVVGDSPPVRSAGRGEASPRSPAVAAVPGASGLVALPAPGSATPPFEPAPAPFETSRLDALVPAAMSKVDDWRSLTVTIPDEADTPVQMRIYRGGLGEPQKRYTVRYDAGTGEEIGWEAFADQSRGRRFRTFLRFAHTGEYFGVWGQTVAGFASLAGVLLVWSGLALAWRRLVVQPLRRRLRHAV